MRVRKLVLACLLAATAAVCASCTGKTVHHRAAWLQNAGIQDLEAGQCVQAEERFRLALEYGKKFEHPHNGLGMVALICENDLDRAAQHFKDALAVNSDFAEAHNNLGTTFLRRNPPKYVEACDQFKAAIEIDPAYGDARENLGLCLMRNGTIKGDRGDIEARSKLYKGARSQFRRLVLIEIDNFNGYHHLGLMDLTEDKYASAERNFKRCLELDAENPLCSYNLGNVYIETARCEEAIEAFISALRHPESRDVEVGARQNLRVAYQQCALDDGALREFAERIKTEPGNPTHHYDLGKTFKKKGMLDRAVSEWENTVKLDPTYCPAYYELAMNAHKVFETDATIALCQNFVACTTEANRGRAVPRWSDWVESCKALVKHLEME